MKVFPRPVAGALRPVVRGQTVRYNLKKRFGRGFTFEELKVCVCCPVPVHSVLPEITCTLLAARWLLCSTQTQLGHVLTWDWAPRRRQAFRGRQRLRLAFSVDHRRRNRSLESLQVRWQAGSKVEPHAVTTRESAWCFVVAGGGAEHRGTLV